jgi:glycosyltransferase involved in cell wall biosynthesis
MKPFVSICTPTYNRRPFIPYLIKCFQNQDYPQDRMEWIIIDDGTDKIYDLVKDISNIKYYSYESKIALGEKRNLMHSKCRGSIIVYMDDDDYYPAERVSHAVERLTANPQALCAGSSIIHIHFKNLNKIYEFGPYGPNHATAGTFAFKKELLKYTRYEDTAEMSEEKYFLKNYTIPFVQLDPIKTILVISHPYNTFDKKKLLINPNPQFVKETKLIVDDFIKNGDMKDFYLNRIHGILKKYKRNINGSKEAKSSEGDMSGCSLIREAKEG